LSNKFVTIMEAVRKDVSVIWNEVLKYLPAAASLASIIFPAEASPIAGVVNSVDLIRQAVASVEQKFAAAGNPTGTGPQKLAQVLTMVSPTVTQLLTSEGLKVDPVYLTNIVNAVVAILNVQQTAVAA